jgi:hypothetical protein
MCTIMYSKAEKLTARLKRKGKGRRVDKNI